MGKKKTPVFRDGSKHNVNKDDGKIKAIRTWDDIEHDSEDEFHEAREKVLLEEKDDFQTEEESEAEVYGLDMESDEEEEEEDEEEQENGSDDELLGKKRDFEEDEEIDESWGNQKRDYYDADEGEDLEEMKEEEAEALKIQKQRLEAMDEADFMDDTLPGWGKGAEKDAAADKALLEDFSKELKNISFDVSKSVEKRRAKMTVAEKLKVLQNESPELLDLLNEFKDKNEEIEGLEAVLEKVQSKNRQDEDVPKFLRFKHQLLMNYMTNVSFYFVLKASGVVDIKSHPVIDALVELRSTLEKAEKVEEELQPEIEDFFANLDAPTTNGVKNTTIDTTVTKAQIPEKKKNNNKKKKSVSKVVEQEPEFSANDLDGELEQDDVQDYQELSEKEGETNAFDVEQEFKSLKKANKKRKRSAVDDFGELDALDELDMEDKIARKRSLRDYVAKIDAKQAKMQSKYQGDLDIPYKERQTKAEKKGVAQPEDTSADLDNDDYDEQDMELAAAAMGQDGEEDDEYYNQVVASKAAQKAAKKAEYDAERAPLIDGDLHVEEGEKRLASYKMLKNKGLTRHRKKETRNARVKNRNKYAKKLKKLSSQRAIVKPLQGAYGGEATGIKSNVVKSIRF